jgi:hypothetical protein
MSPEDQISRYEINRNVRMVLTRHDADLTKVDYSCTAGTVYLYGDLARQDRDYAASEIDSIVAEIAALPHVRDIQFDFNNWLVVSSGNSWRITKIGKPAVTSVPGSLEDSTVVIDNTEKIADVLDDLDLGSKKEDG